MDTILITGGAGFVGASLALGIKEAVPGVRILALDNLKRRGSELNIPRLRKAGIEFIHGDIREPEDLAAAGPAALLLECSAEPSVLAGFTSSPAYVVQTNLLGTVNCLEWARQCGAGILFLSTSRVYPVARLQALAYEESASRFELEHAQPFPGVSRAGIAEDFPLEGARSLYGATKLASELLIQEYLDMYGLKGVLNRCGVLTGPWQMGKVDQGVVALWVARHHYGGRLKYIGFGGTGKQVRDILHVDDLLRLVLHEMEHLDALSGQTFNVGGGRGVSISLAELTALCQEATGHSIPIDAEVENRPADMPIYLTDNARVTAATGWQPAKDARAIVQDIAGWIAANEETLRPILGG